MVEQAYRAPCATRYLIDRVGREFGLRASDAYLASSIAAVAQWP